MEGGVVGVVPEKWQRGWGEEDRGGTIGCGACSQLARVEVRGFKNKEGGGGDRERRERKRK